MITKRMQLPFVGCFNRIVPLYGWPLRLTKVTIWTGKLLNKTRFQPSLRKQINGRQAVSRSVSRNAYRQLKRLPCSAPSASPADLPPPYPRLRYQPCAVLPNLLSRSTAYSQIAPSYLTAPKLCIPGDLRFILSHIRSHKRPRRNPVYRHVSRRPQHLLPRRNH